MIAICPMKWQAILYGKATGYNELQLKIYAQDDMRVWMRKNG